MSATAAAHAAAVTAACNSYGRLVAWLAWQWRDIAVLYQRLLDTAPTIGARIGHAMAVAHAHDDPLAGLRLLDAIEVPGVAAHQPLWATRAHLLARTDAVSEAIDAYDHRAGTAPPSCGSQGEGPRPSELIASGPTPSLHFATAPPVRGRSIGRSTSLPG